MTKTSHILKMLQIPTLLLATMALPSLAMVSGAPVSAMLSGAAEVPVPGDPDGSGTAQITLNVGQGTVCWELTWTGIDTPIAAHIHKAPVGVAGPVVVPLTLLGEGNSSDCGQVDREKIKEILLNPEGYYVNIHNSSYPAGAIRGQLSFGKF